ncbi:FBD-associated F-box protein At5g44490-like [Prosopis cineraria]|uniref:FBD-associated F-box protein At5g44490-like n=1 Tax=Prosopis cineraria TaxID=364024 RepID=UPI00240ED081|nr:FBD-associated F-box protein At5g44490-like [Prosopis cineraria]
MEKLVAKHIASDRSNNLEDPLLEHILSFLPTKQAIAMCLVDKRWHRLWFSVSTLDFEDTSFGSDDFLFKFIESCLIESPLFYSLVPSRRCLFNRRELPDIEGCAGIVLKDSVLPGTTQATNQKFTIHWVLFPDVELLAMILSSCFDRLPDFFPMDIRLKWLRNCPKLEILELERVEKQIMEEPLVDDPQCHLSNLKEIYIRRFSSTETEFSIFKIYFKEGKLLEDLFHYSHD